MNVLEEFRKAIHEAMERDSMALAEGGASDYTEYRQRVGMRKGLRRALQIMEDVVEETRKREEKF